MSKRPYNNNRNTKNKSYGNKPLHTMNMKEAKEHTMKSQKELDSVCLAYWENTPYLPTIGKNEELEIKFNTLKGSKHLNRTDYDKKIMDVLSNYRVTPKNGLVCLAGFMRIISPGFVKKYKNKIINIHPALLPAFPGLNSQKQALDYGAKYTGCTVHFVDAGMDTGPVIIQSTVEIKEKDTEKSLSKKILKGSRRSKRNRSWCSVMYQLMRLETSIRCSTIRLGLAHKGMCLLFRLKQTQNKKLQLKPLIKIG